VPLGTVKKTLAGVEIPAAALLAAKKLAPPAVAAVSVIIRFFIYIFVTDGQINQCLPLEIPPD